MGISITKAEQYRNSMYVFAGIMKLHDKADEDFASAYPYFVDAKGFSGWLLGSHLITVKQADKLMAQEKLNLWDMMFTLCEYVDDELVAYTVFYRALATYISCLEKCRNDFFNMMKGWGKAEFLEVTDKELEINFSCDMDKDVPALARKELNSREKFLLANSIDFDEANKYDAKQQGGL